MIPRLGRRARSGAIAAIAITGLALTGCTGGGGGGGSTDVATVSDGFAGSIDDAIATAMELSRSDSAIVGVWTPESGEYVRAYGDESLDSSARFRAAQTSQPLMCALLLSHVADGNVELDEKVADDLTRQVGIGDTTYAQLCKQTSGLADFKGAFRNINVDNPTRPWTDRELLAQSLVNSPLSWPGLDIHRSDANALLLGRALNVGQHESVANMMRDRVFETASMGSSYVPANNELEVRGDALVGKSYPLSGGDPVCDVDPIDMTEVSPTILGTASSTVTTVTDMKNFYDQYFAGTFGTEETTPLLTDAVPTENPERDENGDPVGDEPEATPTQERWSFGVENVGPLYGLAGAVPGTISAAFQDPETGYTVVVALNNSSAGGGFARNLAFQLASISAENGVAMEVPWTVDGQADVLSEAAVCQ